MRTLILKNTTLIDGMGKHPIPNTSVMVEGERIQEILPDPPTRTPSDATTIDCRHYENECGTAPQGEGPGNDRSGKTRRLHPYQWRPVERDRPVSAVSREDHSHHPGRPGLQEYSLISLRDARDA